MRRIQCVVIMLMAVIGISAQKEVGTVTIYPRVGINWSEFKNDKIYLGEGYDNYVSACSKTGFTGGADVQYQWTDAFAVSGGVMYSQQGTKYEYDRMFDEFDERPQIRVNYLNIPLLAVMTTRYGISLKAGVQPEIKVGDTYKGVFSSMTLSFPIGLAYEWKNICVDLRYNFGVTGLYKAMTDDNSYNRTLMLTLGYGIDL